MFIRLFFSLSFLFTATLSAQGINYPQEINLYQSVKQEGGYFVYTYEIENNQVSDFHSVTFGSDCELWTIPREYKPIETHQKKGNIQVTELITVLAGKDWEYTIQDDEDQSVSHIAFDIHANYEKQGVLLKKGQYPLFKLRSKKRIDSIYFNQPFCVVGGGAQWSGISKNKEWKEIDKKIDLQKTAEACNAKIAIHPFRVDESKPACNVAKIDFREDGNRFTSTCLLNEIYLNRKKGVGNNSSLKNLLQAFDFNTAQKRMTEYKERRNSNYQMFKLSCSLKNI